MAGRHAGDIVQHHCVGLADTGKHDVAPAVALPALQSHSVAVTQEGKHGVALDFKRNSPSRFKNRAGCLK